MDIIPDNPAYTKAQKIEEKKTVNPDQTDNEVEEENNHPPLTPAEKDLYRDNLTIMVKKKRIGEIENQIADHKEQFDYTIELLSNNKDSELAVKLINKYNKDPENYPELLDRLKKKSMRWSLKEFGWEKNELRLKNKPDYMVILAEDIFHQKLRKEAVYLVCKYNLFPILTKKELKHFILNDVPKEEQETLKTAEFNKYLKADEFEPMEIFFEKPGEHKMPYCRFADYNITHEDCIWIDSHDAWTKHKSDLMKSPVVGIDFECVPSYIKWDEENTALMQVATYEKLYFFDFQSKNWEFKIFVEFFDDICANGDIIKLGLQLKADMTKVKWPKMDKLDENGKTKARLFRKYFDVASVYKQLTYDKKSNLAYLTEKLLDKRLSKFEQVNDWDTRPLRKSQLHYGGLDAYVLLKMYEKLIKEETDELSQDDMVEVFQC